MASEWIKARQTKYGAYAFIYTLVILAVVFAINWLAKDRNKSVDVTANKRYTLSDQTRKVVGELKKPLTIYYFEKSDRYEQARDMLDRYKNLNPAEIRVDYVDPEKKPDVAANEGAHNFGDVIVDNGAKKETAKALTEEELTGAIVRDLKNGARNACFVQGSGEHQLDDSSPMGYSTLKDALEKNNYKTQTVSLIDKPEVPKECNVVVIGGPQRDYQQPEVDALKSYVAGGGHALFNLDPLQVYKDKKLADTPTLNALLTTWGITPRNDFLFNARGQEVAIVTSYEAHAITRPLGNGATIFQLARSLDVKSPAEKLFSSTAGTFSLTDAKLPLTQEEAEKATQGAVVLGAASTVGSGSAAGRIVVVGSSNWIANGILSAPLANRDLALNMFNWLTSDEDLISIRPKDPEDRRLRLTSLTPLLAGVVILPLFVIFAGIATWVKRR
jgi:ABC-type uncharacterized transport system involved in gliding motility auxiliary subunit